ADTNRNPLVASKLIATLYAKDEKIINELKRITDTAKHSPNPIAMLHTLLEASFGESSYHPLRYKGVSIVEKPGADSHTRRVDLETRKATNIEPSPDNIPKHTPMEQYCGVCHGGKAPKGAIPMNGGDWKRLLEQDAEEALQLFKKVKEQ